MTPEFEVIVVGAGGMGSAAAYHLARARRSVLLLEQFEIGHNRGASHGHSRIIRLSYEHPVYIRLSKAAYSLWDDLEQDSGERVLTTAGGLDLSLKGHPVFEDCISSMKEVGIDYEKLDATEIQRRCPQFRINSDTVGVFQKDAGILNPSQSVPLMVKMAGKHGAVVKDNTPVTAIHYDENGIQVECGDQVYTSARLIVSAGPWAEPMLEKLGLHVPLKITEERYVFFKPKNKELFAVGRFPIFAHYGENLAGKDIDFYGFPVFGLDGVKVAEHRFGDAVTADRRSFEVPDHVVERMRERTRQLIPDAVGDVIHSMTCLYSNSVDRHFVIDFLPGNPSIVVAAGFSGHGYKFAIVVGRILADLVEKQTTQFDLSLFSLSRF